MSPQTEASDAAEPASQVPATDSADLREVEVDFVSHWITSRLAGKDHDRALVELVASHRKANGLAEGQLLKSLVAYAEDVVADLAKAPSGNGVSESAGGATP